MRGLLRCGIVSAFLLAALVAGPVLRAQENKPVRIKASAIKVEMIQSDEIKLPAEFQVALYEDLIQQLQKKGGLRVYREGDRNAADAADLVVLHSTVRGFKEGSERKLEVTTVAGATSITIHCVFKDKEGKALLESDVIGNVRFFGGNLRATYDFAKKTARITHDHFSPTAGA